jgi:anion-transporting  ArsA/GET3 family ATPase
MIELLKKHKVIICAGTGGVGKTSLSASLGVLAARNGIKTLVLTIDPAQRLAQSLGIENPPGDDAAVGGQPGLTAAMIDPRREFDQFVLGAVDRGIAKELFDNRLYQQLVGSLSGSQEFTSLVRLLHSHQSGFYDLVILDTPPTQNAVDFLRAPERIYALFQDSVISWFANPTQDEGWIKRTLHAGTRMVMGALESATGSSFIGELKAFFSHVSHLRGRIAKLSRDVTTLLHAETTGFILVTGFDEAKLREALEFQQDLANEDLNLRAVVVNRWFPEWTQGEKLWPESWQASPDFQQLKALYEQFAKFFKHRQEVFDKMQAQLAGSVPVVKLPDFMNSVQGLEDLGTMATTLEQRWRSP